MSLREGSRFGPYEIRGRLGSGGMGEVYLAFDCRLRREVALKLLSADVTGGTSSRRRLLAEARLGARLEHPNVCPVYEVGQHDGIDYLAMQRVAGVTLDSSLDGRPLPEAKVVELGRQIADAIRHAHEQGVIHRDLKPQNVMITPEARAVVLDFGLARVPEAERDGEATTRTRTATGVVAGTPSAMSPEQARGERLDPRTDIFSFGTLLYRMLTGREPFGGASTAERLAAVLMREPPAVRRVTPEVSAEMEGIVRKCLEKDRDLRYGSMREVLVDLERLRRDSTERARGTASPIRRRIPVARVLAIAGLTLASLAALTWFALPRLRNAARPTFRTLAVLPFRSISAEAGENYLGLGVADAVISRVSQDPRLVVRPTSAVRRYVAADVAATRAAGELHVDAVLEGTWQRQGDRLRVTANLLRTADGASLWSESFDARSADIFDIQDQISEQVAERLRARMAARAGDESHRGTRNPQAYDAFSKGIFYFSERGYVSGERRNSDVATHLFEEAVRLDPDFARAHAQLAYAYLFTALFLQNDSTLVVRAGRELDIAERLDPKLGLTHFVRSGILWSQYSGWNFEDAIREFRTAERLDPNLSDDEMGTFHLHLGLEDGWRRYMDRAMAQDPNNLRIRRAYVHQAFLLSRPELGRTLQKQLLSEEPDVRYWSLVGDLGRTTSLVEQEVRDNPGNPYAACDLAALRAMQGRCREADSLIRGNVARLTRDRHFHHVTFQLAQTYGLCGDARETVRWLEETSAKGFPCYPLFERDRWLDPVRRSPEFVAFMRELRPKWERFRRALEESSAS